MPNTLEIFNNLNVLAAQETDKDLKKKLDDLLAFTRQFSENEKTLSEESLENFRRDTRELLANAKASEKTKTIVHQAALAVAEVHPVNKQDPITLEEIDLSEENRKKLVFTSSGHALNPKDIKEFHQTRPPRQGERAAEDTKDLVNPLTNEAFSELDAKHIQEIAQQQGLNFECRQAQTAKANPIPQTQPQEQTSAPIQQQPENRRFNHARIYPQQFFAELRHEIRNHNFQQIHQELESTLITLSLLLLINDALSRKVEEEKETIASAFGTAMMLHMTSMSFGHNDIRIEQSITLVM